MGVAEMQEIAGLIADAIEQRDDAAAQSALAGRVAAISGRFAVPGLYR
jgi:glycine/serine hydroxymethyltransferase